MAPVVGVALFMRHAIERCLVRELIFSWKNRTYHIKWRDEAVGSLGSISPDLVQIASVIKENKYAIEKQHAIAPLQI